MPLLQLETIDTRSKDPMKLRLSTLIKMLKLLGINY